MLEARHHVEEEAMLHVGKAAKHCIGEEAMLHVDDEAMANWQWVCWRWLGSQVGYKHQRGSRGGHTVCQRRSRHQVGYMHRGGRDINVAAEVGMLRARDDSDAELATGIEVVVTSWEPRRARHMLKVVEAGASHVGDDRDPELVTCTEVAPTLMWEPRWVCPMKEAIAMPSWLQVSRWPRH